MKKLFILFLFALLSTPTFAVWTDHYPIETKQPDGTVIQCFMTGDEYYLRVHDANNFTIIREPHTGWLVYAQLENDKLVSSGYKIGTVNPADVGLTPGIDISTAQKTLLRDNFYQNTPQKPNLPNHSNKNRSENSIRTGTLNNLVIYIRFADDSEFTRTKSSFESYFNNPSPNTSLYSYFRDISDQKFWIISSFYPETTDSIIVSYQDSHNRNYFLPFDSVTNPDGYATEGPDRRLREHTLLHDALIAVQFQIESAFTSADLDYDLDDFIDNICFVVKGNASDWNTLLWPHRWSLYTYNYEENPMYILGKLVWDYNLILENHMLTASNGKQSVLIHETYHTLSAPDLYRYSNDDITPVGKWDVMASNNIPTQSSSAYVSMKYGYFLDSVPEITMSGTYAVYHIWDRTPGHNIAYRIKSPTSTEEEEIYLEYRKRVGVPAESGVPGEGIVIYRINPNIHGNSDGSPDEIYVYRPNASDNHTNGSLNSANFRSQNFRVTFSNTSNPPCFLTDNSLGFDEIVIDEISASGADSMTFRITIPGSGVQPVDANHCLIYPNPTKDILHIEFSQNQPNKIEIYNIIGELIEVVTTIQSKTTINTSQLSAGTYFIKMYDENKVTVQKFIIQ
ncbi:MAG: T9SS type A sorting domain-containing protein [Bacteroidales bacterium]|jgi:M6 family metalloprotease-like protein|nr:T9SS type A sorting domain-containing protein [Bacteroidales bacterium]